MEPNSKSFSGPSTASTSLPQATSEEELFKSLDGFLDTILFLYREAPSAFRESLAVRLRERVITTLAEADYDTTLRKRVLKKERLRMTGENYDDNDSDDQSNDTAWTRTDEESGVEEIGKDDMETERNGEADDGLPSYSIKDPASENCNRGSPQQNTIPSALSQASVILGVDGEKTMIAKEAASSPYDPSASGFSRLCISKSRKRSASTVSNFPQTLDDGMGIDPDEDSPIGDMDPVKMGKVEDQSAAGGDRGPARKRSKV